MPRSGITLVYHILNQDETNNLVWNRKAIPAGTFDEHAYPCIPVVDAVERDREVVTSGYGTDDPRR